MAARWPGRHGEPATRPPRVSLREWITRMRRDR